MSSFLESLGNYVRNGLCTVIDNLQDFGIGLGAGAEYRGVSASVDILRLTQRLICNREPSPGYDPPFTGGQCPILYTVNTEWTRQVVNFITGCSPSPTENATNFFVLGPILGLRTRIITAPAPDLRIGILEIQHGAGGATFTEVYRFSGFGVCEPEFLTYSIVNVVPPAGVPDDCGSPYPLPPPSEPGSRTFTGPFTYINNEGDAINIDASIRFGDIGFNLNGDLNIGGRITFEGDVFSPEFNFNLNLSTGGINLKPGNPNYPPSGNPNGDDYGVEPPPEYPPSVPNSISPPSPNNPEPGTKKVIRAVIVTVTANEGDATKIFQDDNPDIYAPNLGFVNFGIAIGGVIAWTLDIPVKNYRQIISCPWEGGAVEVRGTPRVGVLFTLSEVYGSLERDQVYG